MEPWRTPALTGYFLWRLPIQNHSKPFITEKRRNKAKYLTTGTTDETFQQSRKQDSFRDLLKSSPSMPESPGSQFFRTITGIQSGPYALAKSRFVMTFLTILGATEILCGFRWVLEGKTGKEIPELSRLEFLKRFSANNFALSDAEDNTSGNLPKVPRAKFVQRLLACLNFTLDSEDLSFWYKRKKWFLWTVAAAQAAENHGDEWGLTWWWGIYTSIPTWTHSQNSLAAAEALSLKIPSHGTSPKWSQRPS